MSKQIITDTNWRGVPCTLRYDDSLKPVCVGDMFGGSPVVGGTAPHKPSSTGYMTYEPYESRYVHGCRWVEDYTPTHWATLVRYSKRVRNMTTGKMEWDKWSQAAAFPIAVYGDDESYLMAEGKARIMERWDSCNITRVVAVDEHFMKHNPTADRAHKSHWTD